MFNLKKSQYIFIFSAAVMLFIVNNIILGSIIPRLPGGSAFGITTMFTVTLLSLNIERFGCIPAVYFIYCLAGIPSHIIANDWQYLVLVLLIIMSATIFDWYLYKTNYKLFSYYIAYPLYMILTNVMNFVFVYLFRGERPIIELNIETIFMSLLLGYSGITLAYLLFKNQRLRRLNK